MSAFPDVYPSPLYLPFNSQCLGDSFELATPDREPQGSSGVWILLRGNDVWIAKSSPNDFPDFAQLPEELDGPGGQCCFVGFWRGRPCRVLGIGPDQVLPEGYFAENILASRPNLSIEMLSMAGVAGQVLQWEKNSRFCSRCGAETESIVDEWGKKCTGCGYAHFPHIHPCVIVLVKRPGQILLARKPQWVPGRYGLVAGFVDFGECLEEAVHREVREETGLEVKNVRYIGSQSWPFPSQIMAGFVADYAGGEIRVEEKELEDVRWFSLDDLPGIPPKRSIARYLIDTYGKGKS